MRKSRLNWSTQEKLIGLFVENNTAKQAATEAGVNKNTANSYFNRLRELIYRQSADPGFIEADFCSSNPLAMQTIRWVQKNRNSRPFGLVFGDNKIHVALLKDDSQKDQDILFRARRQPDYVLFNDPVNGQFCASLNSTENSGVFRVRQCKFHSCPMKSQSFSTNFCHCFLTKQKCSFGIPPHSFHLYLKELEWKFNNPAKSYQLSQLLAWASKLLP